MPKKKSTNPKKYERYEKENRKKKNKLNKLTREIARCERILANNPESTIKRNIDSLTNRIKELRLSK